MASYLEADISTANVKTPNHLCSPKFKKLLINNATNRNEQDLIRKKEGNDSFEDPPSPGREEKETSVYADPITPKKLNENTLPNRFSLKSRKSSQDLEQNKLPTLNLQNITVVLPPLCTITKIAKNEFEGPTSESNWAIPGHLMIGAYPADIDDELTIIQLSSIMSHGINIFVCLQEELDNSLSVTEEMWRSGTKLRPYFRDVQKLFDDPDTWKMLKCEKPKRIEFIHFPIRDLTANASDLGIIDLAISLINKLEQGDKIYMHCWGGHGRAGTVGSVLLGMIYGFSPETSMDYIQKTHDCRAEPLGVSSPQTLSQRLQVMRILSMPQVAHFLEARMKRSQIVKSTKETGSNYYNKLLKQTTNYTGLPSMTPTHYNRMADNSFLPSPPRNFSKLKTNKNYGSGKSVDDFLNAGTL